MAPMLPVPRQLSRGGPAWTPQLHGGIPQETNALMARVQSVSAKADSLLTTAGRPGSQLRAAAAHGSFQPERLVDLTERLTRLEALLDEVSTLGALRPVTTAEPGGQPPPLPRGRFVEVSMAPASAPMTSAVQPPPALIRPVSPGRVARVVPAVLGAGTPPTPRPPGIHSPGMPTPSFATRQVLPGALAAAGWAGASPSLAGHPSAGTPRAGQGFAGGPALGLGTPRVPGQGFGSLGTSFFRTFPPSPGTPRSEVAPRAMSVPVSFSRAQASTPGIPPPPGIFGPAQGQLLQASTPGIPPPPGILGPALGQPLQVSAEDKIRSWLRTIPIGNGSERGWDDSQIGEIAGFAQERHLDHLPAEEIYRRYVEHQVEKSENNM